MTDLFMRPPIDNIYEIDSRLFRIVDSRPTIAMVAAITAEYYEITLAQILGDQRSQYISKPRHVLFFLMHQWGYGLAVIGRRCGRDHTSVRHGVNRVKERLVTGDLGVYLDMTEIVKRVHKLGNFKKIPGLVTDVPQ